WLMATPQTILADLAFLLLLGATFTIIINCNPLIKLDGYYALSQLVGIQNLQGRSAEYVGSVISRIIDGPAAALAPGGPRFPQTTSLTRKTCETIEELTAETQRTQRLRGEDPIYSRRQSDSPFQSGKPIAYGTTDHYPARGVAVEPAIGPE